MSNLAHDDIHQPAGRFDWERVVRRIVMPGPVKFLALTLATYADPNGSRVRPGNDVLAAVTGQSDSTVRRNLSALRGRYGLLVQAHRGGGRGGKGRAAEYQLTIPTDLFDRADVLPPTERAPTVHLVTGQSDESPVSQVTGQSNADPVGNSESPVVQVNGHSGDSSVTQATDENDFHRSNPAPVSRLTVHSARLTVHLGDRLPATTPTTQRDQPDPDPAQPPTARDANPQPEHPPGEQTVRASPRCDHNLPRRYRPDGQPSCAFCRRAQATEERP